MRLFNRFLLLLLVCTAWINTGTSQSAPFSVQLSPLTIPGLGGLQSYAFGQWEGKWLLIGGRLDGLHRRQPFASFDLAGHNNQLIVVDPVQLQTWTSSLTALPAALQEPLQSTNMQYYQSGNTLYLTGGYGYSATAGDHVTFDKLTAVDLPGLIQAIQNNAPVLPYFRQLSDERFRVTGGKLLQINSVYYLIGGQKFMGRYNPMGPTHGPGFIQEYTNQARRFTIEDDGTNLIINHLTPFTDEQLLHRRDYNAVSQIMPDGQEGITAFSGVFQTTVDLPYLNAVNLWADTYAEQPNFQQYYNHYHCAYLPAYEASKNQMHTLFFGGIAQFYDSLGVMVQDNNVPFVKTIARVTRLADGSMAEYKLPVELPGLFGAGAEWIPNENLPFYPNGVLRLDELSEDTTFVGYLFGGIASTAPNIFFTNTGTQSSASNSLFKVNLVKGGSVGSNDLLNPHSTSSLNLKVFPNPSRGVFYLRFFQKKTGKTDIWIRDLQGNLIWEQHREYPEGEHTVESKLPVLASGRAYLITVANASEQATIKGLVED